MVTGRVVAQPSRRHRPAQHPLRALLLAAALGACLGCGRAERLDSIRRHVIHSRLLSKDLSISVLLPPDYSTLRRYPVLYFFGDYGGGPALVTRHVATDPECPRLVDTGEVAVMLLVGVEHDRSFMIETDTERAQVTTSTGMSFATGRYESWFLEEVIPFVEGAYAAIAERSGRYN